MKNIDQIFPIIDITDSKFLNTHESISVAFSIEYEEIFLKSKEHYNSLQEKLNIFIKQLPDYTIYQTISLFDEEIYEPDFSTPDNFLQKNNKLHYLKRSIPVEKQYLILTFCDKPLANGIQEHSITDTLKYLVKNPYENYKNDLETIENQIANAVTSLEGLYENCNLKRLDNDEIAILLYRYFSMDYNYSGNSNNLKLPSYNLKKNVIGEYHIGVLSLYEGREASSYTNANQTSVSNVKSQIKQVKEIGNIAQSQIFPITIGLPFKHAYCTIIQKLNIEKLMLKFELTERALSLPATFGLQMANNKLKDIEVFKSCIHDLSYTPTLTSMAIIIPERDQSLLNIKIEATKSAVANIKEMKAITKVMPLVFLLRTDMEEKYW